MTDQLHTVTAIAKAFGVSRMTAHRWKKDGCPPPPTTRAAVEAWRAQQPRARAKRRGPEHVDVDLAREPKRPNGAAAEGDDESRRWSTEYRRAKAQAAQLNLDRQRGTALPREQVVALWTQRVTEVRQGLLVMSRRIAAAWSPEMTRDQLRDLVDAEARLLLEKYSRPDHLLDS